MIVDADVIEPGAKAAEPGGSTASTCNEPLEALTNYIRNTFHDPIAMRHAPHKWVLLIHDNKAGPQTCEIVVTFKWNP